jgi:hypothetical protein
MSAPAAFVPLTGGCRCDQVRFCLQALRSRHPWVTLPPEVPALAERGDPGKPAAAARIAAALARAPASFQAWAQGLRTLRKECEPPAP